jgi:hypothetical protein
MRAAAEVVLRERMGAEARSANGAPSWTHDTYFEELLAELERRSLAEARLLAQRSVTMRLRAENEALASQLALTTQRLRSVLRSRNEMRKALERTDALDARLRDALARRQEAASATMCLALQQRVRELERQVSEHRRSASPTASQEPPRLLPRSSLVASERRLSWD